MFPDNAKTACVSPLDKHTDDKYSVTNFRPVSLLNAFCINFQHLFSHTGNPLVLTRPC